jgi:hypothetical protein
VLLNGVRSAVTGGQSGGNRGSQARRAGWRGWPQVRVARVRFAKFQVTKGSVTMAVSLRESVQQVSDPRNLDASVEEVFRTMLGI